MEKGLQALFHVVRQILHIICSCSKLLWPSSRSSSTPIPAQRVDKIDAATRKLIDDMVETMYAAPGIGLAATQVDVHKQIIVIDVSEDKSDLRVFINPEITRREGLAVNQEGCLSVPGVYDNVERADSVTVTALDRNGSRFTLNASGLLATCTPNLL